VISIMNNASQIGPLKSRQKWLLTVAVILFLLTGLLLGWFLFPRDDGSLVRIQQRGTLRIGLDASFPPFENIQPDGNIVGFDVDIAKEIAADLGVTPEFINIGFDGLYDALLARRVDLVISGLPHDPRWTEDVQYSQNYFNAGQMLVVPDDNTTISTVEDLEGQTIAVEWGSQADMEGRRLVTEIPNVELRRVATASDAISAVSNRETTAAIVDGVTGRSVLARELRPVTYLTDEWYAAAVHIDSRDLLAVVDRTLTRLEESGEMSKIEARWLTLSE
jgi:polar amino acid transport system substrate-binding protein